MNKKEVMSRISIAVEEKERRFNSKATGKTEKIGLDGEINGLRLALFFIKHAK